MRRVHADERRARLARRHRLASEHQAGDVVTATRSIVCLHATDPASVYLSARARVSALTRGDLDRALYADRTLIKHLSMRRTLFVFSRELLAAATAGPGARVADSERRRTIRQIEASAVASDGLRWLGDAEAAVLAALESHPELSSSQLRDLAPIVDVKMRVGGAGKWGTDAPVGPRLLTILSAAGLAVRGNNRGGWNVSRPMWTSMARWLGSPLDHMDTTAGIAQMTQAWLRAFGPGTANDLRWWLGVRTTDVKRALTDVAAVEVDLDGSVGYLLPDDLDPVAEVEPWVAPCRPWIRPRWAGLTETGISARIGRCCSTRTATPARPRGGTGAWSVAGTRSHPAGWWSTLSRESPNWPGHGSTARRRS